MDGPKEFVIPSLTVSEAYFNILEAYTVEVLKETTLFAMKMSITKLVRKLFR